MTQINGGNDPFINRIKFGNEQPKAVKVDKEIPQETKTTLNQLIDDFNNGKITADEFKAQAETLAEKGGFKITIGSNTKGDPIEQLPKLEDVQAVMKDVQEMLTAMEQLGDKEAVEKLTAYLKMLGIMSDILSSGIDEKEMLEQIRQLMSDYKETVDPQGMLKGYKENMNNVLKFALENGDKEGAAVAKELIDVLERAEKIANDPDMSPEEKQKALAEIKEQYGKLINDKALRNLMEKFLGTLPNSSGIDPGLVMLPDLCLSLMISAFFVFLSLMFSRSCINIHGNDTYTNCGSGALCYNGCGGNPQQQFGCINPTWNPC